LRRQFIGHEYLAENLISAGGRSQGGYAA